MCTGALIRLVIIVFNNVWCDGDCRYIGCETCEDLQTDFCFSCWNVCDFLFAGFAAALKSRSAVLYVTVRTLWPACNKYKVAVIATVTKLPLLFKVHKIWSVDSQENHFNCCNQMSDFMAKKHQIRFRLGLPPDPAGKAYSAPPYLLAWFKGPTSKGREGKGEGEGPREGKGRERKGREAKI